MYAKEMQHFLKWMQHQTGLSTEAKIELKHIKKQILMHLQI